MSTAEATKFYDIKDLIADRGDIAIVIEEHHYTPGHYYISAFKLRVPNLLGIRSLT